jgi:hypothetical protein
MISKGFSAKFINGIENDPPKMQRKSQRKENTRPLTLSSIVVNIYTARFNINKLLILLTLFHSVVPSA